MLRALAVAALIVAASATAGAEAPAPTPMVEIAGGDYPIGVDDGPASVPAAYRWALPVLE